MKFSLSLSFLALASPVAGFDGSIRADSQMGQKLMGKARQLENNNYYAYSWMADAALKFDGCASIPMFERDEGLRSNMVVKFKLCPNNSCSSCRNGGEYIVEMREFVETYQEALQESREYECEYAKESCEYSCENGGYNYQNYDNGGNYNNNYNGNNNQNDDEYCLNMCLQEKGLSYCMEDQGDEQMDLNEFGECRAIEEGNENNNGNNYYSGSSNYQMYYTGAYCTSSGIYAGVFTDSTCTKHAPKGTYEKYNYGYSLPTEPLASSTCMSCKVQNYDNDNNGNNNNNNNGNNNNNNNNGDEIAEICAGLYEEAVKCERSVKATYKDESGCDMIHHVIPKLSKAMNNIRTPSVAPFFAWVFGIGFFALAGYLFQLHKKTGKVLEDAGYTLN